ncbi:MAG: fibrobacter succinogenes major paralogous domain-containing protein [Saprospiraceae bacterium]|nr:fibrobacter succinogenes major paralogous domain-containing protein [Saprospiraceae bacterium]
MRIQLVVACVFNILVALSQPILETEGAILLAITQDSTPAQVGAIRWTGYVFQGWRGSSWENLSSGTVADYDGIRYKTIKLGHQEGMTENLKTTHYNNGEDIINSTSDFTWMFPTASWCWYNNLSSNGITYGRLYNWHAVVDSRGLCPTGWHIPDDGEWTVLTDFLGGLSGAGGKMKEVGLVYWQPINLGATNASGFTGLPGGLRSSDGTFAGLGADGHWWSSTVSDSTRAWSILLDLDEKSARKLSALRGSGYSVRCLKN